MTTTLTEAARMALDALESRCGTEAEERGPNGAITALRSVLSAPADVPALPYPAAEATMQLFADHQGPVEAMQAIPEGAYLYTADQMRAYGAACRAAPVQPVARMHGDGSGRLISEATYAEAARQGGAAWSSVKGYTIKLGVIDSHTAQPAAPAPVAMKDAQIDSINRSTAWPDGSLGMIGDRQWLLLFRHAFRVAERAHGITATPAPTTDTGEQR